MTFFWSDCSTLDFGASIKPDHELEGSYILTILSTSRTFLSLRLWRRATGICLVRSVFSINLFPDVSDACPSKIYDENYVNFRGYEKQSHPEIYYLDSPITNLDRKNEARSISHPATASDAGHWATNHGGSRFRNDQPFKVLLENRRLQDWCSALPFDFV